jgi:hypothetical protein
LQAKPGDEHSADSHLPFLTAAQANRVRYLVRQAFAECGREVFPADALPSRKGLNKHLATSDGGAFDVLLGESVCTASRVLVMDDLLKQAPGVETGTPHGVLATMAIRNQIAIHVIRGRSAVPSSRLMARFALARFSDGAGRLSPNVFWWRDGRWAQVTQLDTDGTISVIDNPDLTSTIQRLGSRN